MQQLSEWQDKNGYAYLKRFVDALKADHLSFESNRRSLHGVAPAFPFSATAFRRYYDHALAYNDFKQASKSEDKHRLYLGLLGGPLYPEAVLRHFVERIMGQIKLVSVDLGKEPPVLGPMPSPMVGDPFAINEVNFHIKHQHHRALTDVLQMMPWKYTPDHGDNAGKMKTMRRYFPGFPPHIHWQYLVLLHRCSFKGKLEKEDTKTLLEMLQGPLYDETAFVATETPLLNALMSLRQELQVKNPKRYYEHDTVWWQIAVQMHRHRDSSHIAPNPDAGRSNEYLAFFRCH